jgi:hypothetical protein
MNTSLVTVRAFIAFFLAAFGIGFMFVRSEDSRILLGAFFTALGMTFLLRLALAVRMELRH